MHDHELYRRILGIEAPWFVDWVDLRLEAGEIHVYLRHHEMINWPCRRRHPGAKQDLVTHPRLGRRCALPRYKASWVTELQHHANELRQKPSEWMPWNYRDTFVRLVTPAAA
jgi:hypothetical protein